MDSIHIWKREPERKRGGDYITPLIYSIFCSSALNNSQTYLLLPSGWAAGARLWIGHISHRPGWAAPLLPLPFQFSLTLSFSVRSSSRPPSFLHFLTLLLLLLLLHHSFQLWMPFSFTVWTQEGKEERVGWRTSGRNGRAARSFRTVSVFFHHGCVWPCEGVSAYMPVFLL